MRVAGLDIGSRTIALVEWDGSRAVREEVVDTGTDPLGRALALLGAATFDRLVATGYGRHLAVERELADEVISEIKAYGLGTYQLYTDVATVLASVGRIAKSSAWEPAGGSCALI